MKKCKKCNLDKSLDCFYKNKSKKDNLDIYCKECGKEQTHNYNKSNKEKVKLARSLNKEHIRNYSKNNRNSINKQRRERLKKDPLFKLSCNIRTSISKKINGQYKKSQRTELILGCLFDEFKLYLESKFESWMTWDNYGKYNGKPNYGWDIDHIIPISFAKNEDEIYKLNNYMNLQPLCSYINRDVKINNARNA